MSAFTSCSNILTSHQIISTLIIFFLLLYHVHREQLLMATPRGGQGTDALGTDVLAATA